MDPWEEKKIVDNGQKPGATIETLKFDNLALRSLPIDPEVSYLILTYLILSCLVLSCVVSSFVVLSYFGLCYVVFSSNYLKSIANFVKA